MKDNEPGRASVRPLQYADEGDRYRDKQETEGRKRRKKDTTEEKDDEKKKVKKKGKEEEKEQRRKEI